MTWIQAMPHAPALCIQLHQQITEITSDVPLSHVIPQNGRYDHLGDHRAGN